MKRLFIVLAVLTLFVRGVYAEDSIAAVVPDSVPVVADSMAVADTIAEKVVPNLLDSMYGVQVIQDSTVARLLKAAIQGGEEWIEITGYRVQVYSSNQQQTAKTEALRLEGRLKDQLTQTVYVQYAPPFWKVRIGDFRTYEEAKEYKREVVQQFPNLVGNTYIVRDKIKVLK
jgi:hypothetical protein